MKPLLLTVNSPGEVAGWATPLAEAYHQRGGTVVVIILPCNFATGNEADVAWQIPGVEQVFPASELWSFLTQAGEAYRGCPLIHLGGDLMYAVALTARWGLKTYPYLWTRPWWNRFFQGFFTREESGVTWLEKRKAQRDKIHVVGDLTVDAIRLRARPTTHKQPQVMFMPGSREQEVLSLTPMFLEIAQNLKEANPELTFTMALSPFIPEEQVPYLLSAPPDPRCGGVQAHYRLQPDGVIEIYNPNNDASITVLKNSTATAQALSQSRITVSIPGTKTAEAAALGTPPLTLVPLNRPEDLPMHGLLGLLDYLPYGKRIKGWLIMQLKDYIHQSLGPIALPNQRAGYLLTPELVGILSCDDITEACLQLLDDPNLAPISQQLLDLYDPLAGAADKMVDLVIQETS